MRTKDKPPATLRDWMTRENFNQGDLAKLLNRSQAYVSRLLSGKRRCTVDDLFKLSQLSGIRMDVLAVALHGKRVA